MFSSVEAEAKRGMAGGLGAEEGGLVGTRVSRASDLAGVEELRAAQKLEADALALPVHGENRQGKTR